jgi:hypothetical protein
MRVFETRVLRGIFGLKMNAVKLESGENFIMRSLFCTHPILCG